MIDETTAVVRFIFPYTDGELKRIQFLFQSLFVKSIIQLVSGEEQIWMLEDGPERSVHIWKRSDVDEDEDEDEDEDDES